MQKGFASFLILIGLLITAVVGAGGYYFHQSQTKTSDHVRLPYLIPASSVADETTNWKTFSFNRGGLDGPKFEIKYPDNWDYKEMQAGEPLVLYFFTPADVGQVDTLPKQAPVEVHVFSGWVDRCPCEEITIAGVPAKRIMLENWEIIEITTRDDYVIDIMRSLKPGLNEDTSLSTEEEIAIFNKIVQSFKFLDSNSDTSNWKTYVNDELAFKYPQQFSHFACVLTSSEEKAMEVGIDFSEDVASKKVGCGLGSQLPRITIGVVGVNETIDQYLKDIPVGSEDTLSQVQTKNINGHTIGFVIRTMKNISYSETFYAIANEKTGKVYSASVINNNPENEELIEKILSTFKFL